MNGSALAFVCTPLNKNSVAVLAGVLEMEETFADLDLLFIRDLLHAGQRAGRGCGTTYAGIVCGGRLSHDLDSWRPASKWSPTRDPGDGV